MSGRALHYRDGELITNRKTDRRQSPKRPIEVRVQEADVKLRRRFPSKWVHDVRLSFLLPKPLAPFVASGLHHHNIIVHRGFVQVMHGSSEECLVSAADFFAIVARDREAFTVLGVITSSMHPGRVAHRYLTVVNGAMVVSTGYREPVTYEGRHGA